MKALVKRYLDFIMATVISLAMFGLFPILAAVEIGGSGSIWAILTTAVFWGPFFIVAASLTISAWAGAISESWREARGTER